MSELVKAVEAARPVKDRLGKIADLLERSGIDLDEVGRVEKINIWQGFYKDDEGNAHTVDMAGLTAVPTWADGPAWPVVAPAKPTVVRPPKLKPLPDDGWQRAVILPDPQIGFRRDIETGELDPFHDETAISVALQIIRRVRPHVIINLGDTMDLPEFGTFEQEPGFAFTTQATLDRTHLYLAEQKAAAGPELEAIHLLEGNHDRRLEKAIRRNAMAAFGLKRANEPDSWPVMSVPNLLRLDELGVTYHGGYPAGIVWVNDRLACIHGHKVRSSGSTAAAVIDDEAVSVIFGHVHRIELQHRTRRNRFGRKQTFAASPGALCRTDGAVPSAKSSTDPLGRPVTTHENWQQGVAVVDFQPGDGLFNLELVPIHDGWARFRGKDVVA